MDHGLPRTLTYALSSRRRFGAAPTAFAPPFFAALAATKLAYEAPRSVLIFASTASVFFSSPVAARRWRRVGAARWWRKECVR